MRVMRCDLNLALCICHITHNIKVNKILITIVAACVTEVMLSIVYSDLLGPKKASKLVFSWTNV